MSTDDRVEDLPSSIAWAAARASPLEHPSVEATCAVLNAFTELAVVRVLAEALHAPEALPFAVESAMRLVMLEEMEAEGWLDLYAALEHSGLIELLGLPADPLEPSSPVQLPVAVRDAMHEIGETELVDWLDHARTRTSDRVVPAVAALARAARGWSDLPLHYVRSIREQGDGWEVEARRLVGTAWPGIRRTRHVARPPLEADRLAFWDGEASAIGVPAWLLRWDEPAARMWLFTGRSATNGHWRHAPRLGWTGAPSEPSLTERVPGVPPFLVASAWSTTGEPARDPNAQTQIALRLAPPVRTTGSGAVPRVTAPVPGDVPEAELPGAREGARLAIRVVTGPDLMRYVLLDPGDRVVVGRNSAASSLVLDHHQLSRAHTEIAVGPEGEVTVRDLGSTNGTHLQGRTIPTGETLPIEVGARIGVGPVVLHLDWLTRERRARLDTILDLVNHGDEREPTTLLLRAAALSDRLPRALRTSFRDGGPATGAPSLWGVLLYVDRLAAIHAQHGERIADRVFHDVVRVLQYEVEIPENWVRVGYGEVLYPFVGAHEALARSEAERLCAVIAAHPWEAPIERLSLTASIGQKDPAEAAQEWLRRLRTELRASRTNGGRPKRADGARS